MSPSSTTATADPAARVVERADAAWRTRLAGDYAGAREAYAEALALAEAELAADDPALVHVLNGIGVLGKYAGRFEDAAAAYRRAVQIEAGRATPDADLLATLLHNVGGLDHARGRFAEAEASARQGLTYRLAVRRADDPLVAVDEAALAAILVDLERPAEALELAQRACATYAAATAAGIEWAPPDHREHDRIAALAILATAQHRRRDRSGAAQTYREVLAAKEALLGRDHPELVPTLNNLGVLLAELGELDEAADAYGRALDLLAAAGLGDHLQAFGISENLKVLDRRRARRDGEAAS